MKVCAIASGSNGNSYYIESETDSIVVDLGISNKQFVQRMIYCNFKPNRLSAVVVSHEHSDHIRGIEMFCKTFEVPIYITEKTFNASKLKINDRLVNFFKPDKRFNLGSLSINPFLKNHDAVEPCSFLLNSEKQNVSVMTDIGMPCQNVLNALKLSDVSFLESNYDENMLLSGGYPHFLKKRVAGDTGHLSNYQASMLALEHAIPRLKKVFLSHLSENNNTPELAYNSFTKALNQRRDLSVETILTKRDGASSILELDNDY